MESIFSSKPKPVYSNWIATAAATVGSLFGSLTEGACFGDAACQQNREMQTQAELLNAQAQLLSAQNAAKPPYGLYAAVGVVVLLAIAALVVLSRKKA